MNIEEALVIVENVLDKGRLNKVEEIVFRLSWEGLSYTEIAKNSGYEVGYIRDTGFKLWQSLSKQFGKKVTKNNFCGVLKRRVVENYAVITENVATETDQQAQINALISDKDDKQHHQDWSDAVDTSIFYGRTAELTTLKQWVVQEHCRLVTILGMGGIGKTSLAAKLAEQVQQEFKYLIWRSLRNAPSLKQLLDELNQLLSIEQQPDLPENIDSAILRLIEHLRSSRCLLVLDNLESILQSGDRLGCYREGYESYGQLLRCIAETPHQSCLVLTSREKPIGLAAKEGEALPVRCLHLSNLPISVGRAIFQAKGCFCGEEEEWRFLIQYYGGNPLALKMVAPIIQELFDGSISKFLVFLKREAFVFDEIRNFLTRQFSRLSSLEKEMIYWLAINQSPVSPTELELDFLPKVRESEILEILQGLQRRSLIEKTPNGFTLQPFIMSYIVERLIKQVSEEVLNKKNVLLRTHALLKINAKADILDAQIQQILQPIIEQLTRVMNRSELENQLKQLLIQDSDSQFPGYANQNIVNILKKLQKDIA